MSDLVLTARQRELLETYIDCRTIREAGDRLGLAEQTVKNHLTMARQSNGAATTRELIYRLAVERA